MIDIEEQLQLLNEKYPLAPHTHAGRLCSTIRRMKAEKEVGIPVERRTEFAMSVKDGKPANELSESRWEQFCLQLSDESKTRCPKMHKELFGENV